MATEVGIEDFRRQASQAVPVSGESTAHTVELIATRLRISELSSHERTQVRVELKASVVGRYAKAMGMGAKFPPILVYREASGPCWVADGHHRIAAARKASLDSIDAIVRPGTDVDAIVEAAGLNEDHGLRRSRKDKRRSVEIVVSMRDKRNKPWSNREVARMCGVSRFLVARILREMSQCGRNATPLPIAKVLAKIERACRGIHRALDELSFHGFEQTKGIEAMRMALGNRVVGELGRPRPTGIGKGGQTAMAA